MKRVLVVCHLDGSQSSGQEAKTVDTIHFLSSNCFDVDVLNYGFKNPLYNIFLFLKKAKKVDYIILMPGGRKALSLFTILARRYVKNKIVIYLTVGGWVGDFLSSRPKSLTISILKKFDSIFLQSKSMVRFFEQQGFNNVHWVSTFSARIPLTLLEFNKSKTQFVNSSSFNFCYFARVSENKGILLAIRALIELKTAYPNKDIALDIYGGFQDDDIKQKVFDLCSKYDFIRYKGVLKGDNIIKILSAYYCMLFPTFYPGEGMPHTIVESFMAGLPVIASDWKYNSEFIHDGLNGLLFETNNFSDLYYKMEYSIKNKSEILGMRDVCYRESCNYNSKNALLPLLERIQ